MFSLNQIKGLPNGISDFKILREKNYYYVDKSTLIEELQQEIGKTILFTRPRRFGKTLNMSMLQYFWNIQHAEENRKLFHGLKIENSPHIMDQGKYPVIYLSFKDIKERSWEECKKEIKKLLSDLYDKYHFLRESLNQRDLKYFDDIWLEKEESSYSNALKDLSKYLCQYYQKKVVILIDEYDTSILSAYEHGYYEEAISFFRTFYSAALKDNEYLQIGIMTGILRVAKEGIFSGLNNLSVYSILDEKYSSYFGLTEKEVREALEYYELDYNIQEVKEWYDGYLFGNTEMYNPWSIISYMANKKIEAYWIGTSSNALINQMLEKARKEESDIFQKLESLFQGKSILQQIQKGSDFHDLVHVEEVWQLFLYSGYLTIEREQEQGFYQLRIPNKEVYSFFQESFIQKFLGNVTNFSALVIALMQKQWARFEEMLQTVMMNSFSYFDITMEDEKIYHVFMIGLLSVLQGEYYIHSNKESGFGRYDISMEPRDNKKSGFILEFKLAKSEEELEKKAKEALEQIESKKYITEMKEREISNILGLGIAFYGKKVKIAQKNL
ncbi:AAA family ATPase [Fusobacterium necrophorum]|uniref:9-O-acetyl-N-acetylneuraminate esterase n=2 Tax=Fusobacterium necrophorum TaxID=859 RepID=A0AB73C040_9FUSO|nr:AAA family ATPase [Fusobacterium necrophorum]KDE69301.1 9-O-acetyl-N-acetylneuraminate esterase [Fusobacterium necrophorum DJ-2]